MLTANQYRSSGEEYFTHPLAVADLLIGMKLDSINYNNSTYFTMSSRIVKLHLEDISKTEFGEEISKLVDGVTKLSKLDIRFGFAQAENFRKLTFGIV